ncbi:hypothetical protein [Flavobacterium sp.]|uniref:hypothetical protein n=1 Tax=Flavobacterium sp. TaxID=239 RepID=UPI003A952567
MGNEERKHNENGKPEENKQKESETIRNPDKYLAMEQPGVSYTKEHAETDSDNINPDDFNGRDEWDEEGGNSIYSEAFNQDDSVLSDNIDLDEDQNKSVSSDDDDFEESNERYTN